MCAQAHGGKGTHNPLPQMESRMCTERGQTTDKKQKTTNYITLSSRQGSSLISNNVFNIDNPANGAIRLNRMCPDNRNEFVLTIETNKPLETNV